jgi:hypothetical protein
MAIFKTDLRTDKRNTFKKAGETILGGFIPLFIVIITIFVMN